MFTTFTFRFQNINNKCSSRVKTMTLPVELTNTTDGTYLPDINDDCLLEIFSLRSLTEMDLCSIAETCTRFNQIIKRVFPKKFEIYINNNDYEFKSRDSVSSGKQAFDVERILKNFGPLLQAITISDVPKLTHKSIPTDFLNLLTRNRYSSLLKLEISFVEIPEVYTVKLKPIFKHLQQLFVCGITIKGGGRNLFANCDSLIELKVHEMNNCDVILDNVFPKLERFIYRNTNYDFEHFLSVFISRHKSLKTLDINSRKKRLSNIPIMQVIAESSKELVELKIKITLQNQNELFSLQRLDKLKELKIDFGGHNATKCIIPHLQAIESLEVLSVWNIFDNLEFISNLSLLKKLRELFVYDCLNRNTLTNSL